MDGIPVYIIFCEKVLYFERKYYCPEPRSIQICDKTIKIKNNFYSILIAFSLSLGVKYFLRIFCRTVPGSATGLVDSFLKHDVS